MSKKCIICGRLISDDKNIGFIIKSYPVCSACEYLISIVPVHSALYEHLKNGIKKVLIKEPA